MSTFRKRAIGVAAAVADRLIDLECGTGDADRFGISGRGLIGNAGICVFFAGLLQAQDAPAYRTALALHMKKAAELRTSAPGLFVGVHGVLAACTYVVLVEPRYRRLLEKCIDVLVAYDDANPVPRVTASNCRVYDMITGAAGQAIALATAQREARASCDYLVWLLEDPIRWRWTHPLNAHLQDTQDLGMAHGLPGVLAALAIAAPREGVYERALEAGLDDLCSWRSESDGRGWPATVHGGGELFGRSAWCYGAPGCAAALLLGAQRLGEPRFANVARDALKSLASLEEDQWLLQDEAICHGIAGNALIYAAASEITGDEELRDTSLRLGERLLKGFDGSLPLGFQTWSPEGWLDTANLLQGAAGIALVVLTLAGACDSSWMTHFGIPPVNGRNE